MKVNLGCGNRKIKDYVNVDLFGSPDVKHNLDIAPYPFKDNSVDHIICMHCLEHLKEPELFFSEVKRILKVGGIIQITVPHRDGKLAYSTFGHRGFYHECAIDNVCNDDNINDAAITIGFKHLSTKIIRGSFFKWQKREIVWTIQKRSSSYTRKVTK